MAQQLVDVVTLRPEVQLCYVGLLKDCFEILEAESSVRANAAAAAGALDANTLAGSNTPSIAGDDNETASNGSFSEEDDSVDGAAPDTIDALDNQSESDAAWASDGDSFGEMDFESPSREFQARQIMFYDEVAIFKARGVKL